MAENKIDGIPKFTSDETSGSEPGIEEVKQVTTEEVVEPGKETQTELPADIKPAEEVGDNTGELLKQVHGLSEEREKLLKEIQELRGTRREIKQEEIKQVDTKIDELKDLHPDDIAVIDKILRVKGYVTKDEANKMFYDTIKSDELEKFLTKYPEYKPENDKNDINWNILQRELSYYRMPTDPHKVGEVLERAHKAIQKPSSDRSVTEKKQKLEIAGVGAGGTQRSSSGRTLTQSQKDVYLRGGWSEEEIKQIESKLPE